MEFPREGSCLCLVNGVGITRHVAITSYTLGKTVTDI